MPIRRHLQTHGQVEAVIVMGLFLSIRKALKPEIQAQGHRSCSAMLLSLDRESPSRLRQSHPGYQPRREQRGAANSKGSNCQYRFKNHGNTETLMHIRKARMCLSLQQSVPNSNAAKGG